MLQNKFNNQIYIEPAKKKAGFIKSSAGLTLIEILVTVVVFVLIISTALGIFVSIVRYQRRILIKQELLNQTSYIMEYMSRALRFVSKDRAGTCLSRVGLNYENPGGDTSRIKFINHLENNICQEFYLDTDGILKEKKDGESASATPLISDKLQINSLKFKLFGESETDSFQPKATIFLDVQAKGGGEQPKIKIQTAVSQRNLDE